MKLRLVCAVLVSALVLTGCSDSEGEQSNGLKTYDEATAEYQAAQAQLKLPPGAGPEAWGAPLLQESGGEPVLYQPGAATTRVHLGWLCAWEKEWLATRGVDAAREGAALKQLESFAEMSTYQQNFDDNSKTFYTQKIAAAKLGDPTKVQEHVTANCAP
jgi:hypothetical protein